MELMYLTFQEDAPLYVGVLRKIRWQARAFQALGYRVTYTLWQGSRYRFVTESGTEEKDVGGGSGILHRFAAAAEDYLARRRFDVLYLRLDRMSFDILKICRMARKNGAGRIIIEFPNYPYLANYIGSVRGVRPFRRHLTALAKVLRAAAEDRIAALFLHRVADAAVLIGDHAGRVFGLKAVRMENGVDVGEFSPVPEKRGRNADEVVLIGVAGTLWWQAYDRVLAGMYAYRQASPGRKLRLRFLMVGGDAKEMPAFRAQIRRYGLEDDVECPGFQTGQALDELYARADVGVSSLGCYRRGLTSCSSLKAREYCAKGLPFLYAYEDAQLAGVPFAVKLPNDSSPVDMETVVRFVERCRSHPGLGEEERRFAREHYDWKNIMRQVLDFAGTGSKRT